MGRGRRPAPSRLGSPEGRPAELNTHQPHATQRPAPEARPRRELTRMDNTIDPSDKMPTPPASVAAPPGDGPDNPHRLANGYLQSVVLSPAPGLVYWRDVFHRYQGGAYRPVPDGDQRGELTKWIRDEFLRLHAADLSAWLATDDKLRGRAPTVRPVTTGLVRNVLQALESVCLLPAGIDPPAWINGASGPDPARLVPLLNGLLDPGAESGSLLIPATADYFCIDVAPVEYVPGAAPRGSGSGSSNNSGRRTLRAAPPYRSGSVTF